MFEEDNLDIEFSDESFEMFNNSVCKILLIGVGGAGCNAITRLMGQEVHNTDFVAVNTDVQALYNVKREAIKSQTKVPIRLLQIGKNSTRGLGAGARPDKGREAAEESVDDIRRSLKDIELCFIAAGMGGGTGTGAAPVIARIAKEMNILTIAVVTKPFEFEGKPRMTNAEAGIEELKDNVDTLIVIPNDKLDKSSINNAFAQADDVLLHAIKGIGDLISKPLTINLDFADICTIMRDKGYAHIGIGSAKGQGRAVEAVRQAVNNQLTETTIYNATGLIIYYQAGNDFAVEEIKDATNLVHDVLEDDANIIWGVNLSPDLGDRLDVVVIATGFKSRPSVKAVPLTTDNPTPQPQQEEPRYTMGNVPKFVNRLHNAGGDDRNH
jgi:cell division protein FtsZ